MNNFIKICLLIFTIFILGKNTLEAKSNIPPRTGHSAIYDSANNQMIIFSGKDQAGQLLLDLWTFDIENRKWAEIKQSESPIGRYGHSAIYDSENRQMIIFGGVTTGNEFLSDTWIFDIARKRWISLDTEDPPSGRANHSAIYDSENHTMIIFGGYDQTGMPFSDLWIFDIKKRKWKGVDFKNVPDARYSHSAIYVKNTMQMIIIGGIDNRRQSLFNMWVFDIKNRKWNEIEPDESPAAIEAAIYDESNKHILIFGGSDRGTPIADTWLLDMEGKTWKKLDIKGRPAKRYSHSAIYDSKNKQMIIFGGSAMNKTFSDLWALNAEKNSWEKIKVKGAIVVSVASEEKQVEGAKIAVKTDEKTIAEGVSGKDGSYEVDVEDGNYAVTVKKDGFKEQSETITIKSGKIKEIKFNLEKE